MLHASQTSKIASLIDCVRASFRQFILPVERLDGGRIGPGGQTDGRTNVKIACLYDLASANAAADGRRRSRQKWIAVLNHPVDENWKTGSKLSASEYRPTVRPGQDERAGRRAEPSAGWLNLENVIAFVDGGGAPCAQTAYETRSLASRTSLSVRLLIPSRSIPADRSRPSCMPPTASERRVDEKTSTSTSTFCQRHVTGGFEQRLESLYLLRRNAQPANN